MISSVASVARYTALEDESSGGHGFDGAGKQLAELTVKHVAL